MTARIRRDTMPYQGTQVMTCRGRVKFGMIVLDQPVNLPEGAVVEVHPLADEDIPTIYDRFKDIIGIADSLPADSSVNHNHYLYGTPKR